MVTPSPVSFARCIIQRLLSSHYATLVASLLLSAEDTIFTCLFLDAFTMAMAFLLSVITPKQMIHPRYQRSNVQMFLKSFRVVKIIFVSASSMHPFGRVVGVCFVSHRCHDRATLQNKSTVRNAGSYPMGLL